MAGWRDRIDHTTNWAITVVAAMLSISLSSPTAHHGVLLFGIVIVTLLLWIEARRYRFFDVYRARVRVIERHWFAEMLDPRPDSDPAWLRVLGADLRRPQFILSQRSAMSRRLRRNYIWIYLILLLAWLLKVSSVKLQEGSSADLWLPSFGQLVSNAALGPLPGWAVWIGLAAFYAWLLVILATHSTDTGELAHGEVHV